MNGFKKLILTSAIIAASSSAMAMQAMDDSSLSSTTGQDGITIKLDVDMQNLNIKYVDRDGVAGDPDYFHAGAVQISPLGIHAENQTITIDAGGDAGDTTGAGQLRIGIQMGNLGIASDDTIINLNNTKISVADAVDTANLTANNHANIGATTDIITFDASAELRIAAGATMTMRLGNRNGAYTAGTAYVPANPGAADTQPGVDGADGDGITTNDTDQGYVAATPAVGATPDSFVGDHLITMSSSIPSISLTGLTVLDAIGGGAIGIGKLSIDNVNSSMGIDVVPNGLRIDTQGTTVGGIALENVQVGTVNLASRANAIGDIYITGAGGGSIAMNNVITISGH